MTSETDNFADKPYASFVEEMVKNMFDINPTCISMQMRDVEGKTYTCYWETSPDDRAIMIDAMRDDAFFDWIENNKDAIKAILEEEGDEGDEPCEPDTEADSEG